MVNLPEKKASRPKPAARQALRRPAWLREVSRRASTRAALVGCVLLAGCVERRLTIRSDPPGALCVVDGRELGFTPVSTNFVYYGTREVRLVKDGYETLTVLQPMSRPWWDTFPVEFVTENLLPRRFRDEKEYDYQLQPARMVTSDELYNRAEELRTIGHQGVSSPPEIAPPAELGPQVAPY